MTAIKNHRWNGGNLGKFNMENLNQNETSSQTQSAQILKALKNGERLTHLDAEKRFNCLRLGARIYDLKKRGHNIISERISVPSGKTVAQYRLEA